MNAQQKIKETTILYIEDDAITRKQLSQYLKSQSKLLHVAKDGQEGLELYKKPEYLMEAVNLQLVQYLVKPISLAKLTEVLNICSEFLSGQKVKSKKYMSQHRYYDQYTKELIDDNKIIDLSKYERAIMELMINSHPAPVSYDNIDENIYDYSASKNAIKLLIKSLREKVGKDSVANLSGYGYKLNLLEEK